jgi:hypothetical protein
MPPGDPNNVMVEDLSNGKRAFADGSDLEVANVTSLVLRAKGSVAWIQTSFSKVGESLRGFTVAKAEHGQPAVVLASGEDIDPGSLALAGKRLYWTKARQAPLRAARLSLSRPVCRNRGAPSVVSSTPSFPSNEEAAPCPMSRSSGSRSSTRPTAEASAGRAPRSA